VRVFDFGFFFGGFFFLLSFCASLLFEEDRVV
jgi:hypothetical protein